MPIIILIPKTGAAAPAAIVPAEASAEHPGGMLEIAWDTEPTSSDTPTWTDVTPYLKSFSIRRGRQKQLERVEPGTATFLLDNYDDRFIPTDVSGPYYPDVKIFRRIRFTASVYTGVDPFELGSSYLGDEDALGGGDVGVPLFVGFIERLVYDWPPRGFDATVTVQAVDAMRLLSMDPLTINVAPLDGETSGARMRRFFEENSQGVPEAYLPPPYVIETGTGVIQTKDYFTTTTLMLDNIREIEASEGGLFFVARDGTATFFGANHYLEWDTRLLFGTDGERFVDVDIGFDEENLYNTVIVTAPGLTDQQDSDAASQASYMGGAFTSSRILSVDTLLYSEVAMLAKATEYLNHYKEPRFYIHTLDISNIADDWRLVLERDLWDQVRTDVNLPSGTSFFQSSLIEGIEIDSPNMVDWRVHWQLSAI